MDIEDYRKIYNKVTGCVLSAFAGEDTTENVVFSPLSILLLLGMAAEAVQGRSREEITKVIAGNKSFGELEGILHQMQSAFADDGAFLSANAVCINRSIRRSINKNFEGHLREVFDGKLFLSNNMAADVNRWVYRKTKRMIPNVLDAPADDMLACLINAVAFKAQWEDPYEDGQVDEGDFHNADGSVTTVQMMNNSESSYIEDESFTGFVRPYRGGKYAFMALLPKERGSRAFSHHALEQIDFTALFESACHRTVYASLPQFRYDFGRDLTGFCQEMGITTIFTQEADFSPLSAEWLRMDSILHKAHITVDQCGTKAAAATLGVVVAGCAIDFDFKEVCLDRPFIYAIMNTETGLPVFTGLLNDMSQKNRARKVITWRKH